jgi:hypothetical protein
MDIGPSQPIEANHIYAMSMAQVGTNEALLRY